MLWEIHRQSFFASNESVNACLVTYMPMHVFKHAYACKLNNTEVAMRRMLAKVALVLVASGASSWADTILYPDPLHGYCQGVGQCIDNGTNSPTTNNPPINFGFTVSPGPASGDFLIDVLVPNNEARPASFAITGTQTGTATLFSATPWTTGNLAPFLGISASPDNPIGAFLPSTQGFDPGTTGFFVFQVDLGSVLLQDASNPNVIPLLNISPDLPLASYIVGFLNEGTAANPNWVATANSGAIFERDAPPAVPEPSSIILLGSVTAGIATLLKRRAHGRV
jgi:hypothetical protein